jgi:dihydroorotate dehydrogenase (NAD+) catalytic subunit
MSAYPNAIYLATKSYEWNYDNGPQIPKTIPNRIISSSPLSLWNHKMNSCLGVPAGPLLHSGYIKLYSELGYDVLVYKTVRSIEKNCHPNPNCMYMERTTPITEEELGGNTIASMIQPHSTAALSITNSFGVPSKPTDQWQADIALAQSYIKPGQLMIVSVMGSQIEGEDLVADYVKAASLAKDAGAKAIEINFSCPNIASTCGALYEDMGASRSIAKAVKKAIGDTPLIIKLGFTPDKQQFESVICANAPYIDGIAAINTLKMTVLDKSGHQALPGSPSRLQSGVCGAIIQDLALETIRRLQTIKIKHGFEYEIFGGGGAHKIDDIQTFQSAGAKIVMIGTAAMWDPMLASRYHTSKA